MIHVVHPPKKPKTTQQSFKFGIHSGPPSLARSLQVVLCLKRIPGHTYIHTYIHNHLSPLPRICGVNPSGFYYLFNCCFRLQPWKYICDYKSIRRYWRNQEGKRLTTCTCTCMCTYMYLLYIYVYMTPGRKYYTAWQYS